MSRPSGRVEGDGREAGGSGSRCPGVKWEVRLSGHVRLVVSEPPIDGEGTGGSERRGNMA